MARPFEIHNPDALTAVLHRAALATAESTLRQAAASGATVFKDEVIIRVPKDTGELAEGVTVTYIPEESVAGKLATYAVVVTGTYPNGAHGHKAGMRKSDVARLLEFGTSKMAGEPFIRPAFEAKKSEAGVAVVNKIQEVVNSGG